MGTMLALLGLVLGAWSVRSICIKPQSNTRKFPKAIFAGFYFLAFGGLAGQDENKATLAIIMLLAGAAVQYYCNSRYKSTQE
ncbi:hypothetical protein AAH446_00635 [Erwinia sp. P6884]|uniref:hypothetical protein n=1 Tax=Erwinia sp. P6884 TaxID=3141450 RepID=UPI00318F2D3C